VARHVEDRVAFGRNESMPSPAQPFVGYVGPQLV